LVGEFSIVEGELRFMGLSADDLREICRKLDKENERFNRRSKVLAKRIYGRQLEANAKAAEQAEVNDG
jgi:hypothetical protein